MHSYSAYGLKIVSEFEMPELLASEAPFDTSDVSIVRSSLAHEEAGATGEWAQADGDAVTLRFGPVGTFRISGGSRIEVSAMPGVSEDTLRLPLLGAATAVLLQQRGLFALHGSAIDVGGRAVIFVGHKGQGKSTLASALYGRGHAVIADDIVVVDALEAVDADADSCTFEVRPAFPQFKLVPDSLKAALGHEEEDLPLVSPILDKRAFRARERFATHSLPLARLYVLQDGDWDFSPLPPQEALLQIITHSYSARFGKLLISGAAAAPHFTMCSRLAGSGLARRAQRPRDLSHLQHAAQRVEEDVETDLAQVNARCLAS